MRAHTLLPVWQDWTHGLKLSGKQARGQDVSATLLPRQDVNKAQTIIQVHIDQTPCLVPLDSGCSYTIVTARLCCTWSKRSIKITTINGKIQVCCGVGSEMICTDSGGSAKVNVLVMRKDILGFDLQFGYNIIKALGGVHIKQAGIVQFLKSLVCTALCADQPN